MEAEALEVIEVRRIVERLKAMISMVVVGQTAVVEALMVALLAEGHVLLEGPPGLAKTLLARTFAQCLGLDFNRIQFTPDLMPGDVTGTNLFDFRTSEFKLTRGPVFTDFLLADEINRTPPKTQSSLLQAMQERLVTIDGVTHELSEGFLVVATQNPIEQEGTYPLPEAQLDRFLLKVEVPFPTRDEERKIVQIHGNRTAMPQLDGFGLKPVADLATLARIRATVRNVRLSEELIDYVVDLIRATRAHPAITHGASPRAANMLATTSRAVATLKGRDFVIPDDVKHLFLASLRHRIVLAPGAEVEGATPDRVLTAILGAVAAPRLVVQPTTRAVTLFAPGILLAALPALLGEGLWWIWAGAVGLFALAMAIDAAFTPAKKAVDWTLELPARLSLGRGAQARVTVRGARHNVLVSADLSTHAAATGLVPVEDGAASLPLVPLRRGELEVETLWVRFTGPLGLVKRTLALPVDQRRPIIPDVTRVRGQALNFSNRHERRVGTKVEKFQGEGSEFEALREYLPGMDIRSIDWKSSARHRALLCREFRAERNHAVVFAVDTGYRMCEPLGRLSRLDHAVQAALEMAWVGLKQGDRVGFFDFGARPGRFVRPRSGARTFDALLGAASGLAYGDAETNYTLGLTTLATRLTRRTLVVVMTDFADAIGAELLVENLGRLARRHLVIFVSLRDPALAALRDTRPDTSVDLERAIVADELLQEREVVQAQLKRQGIACVDATPSQVGTALINRYLQIVRREAIG